MDSSKVRKQFPALKKDVIFFDNPGGTQVAQSTLDRVNHYLVETNANHAAAFATSQASDLVVDEARSACADFLNASRSEEIVFGPNMTSLTLNISRSIGRWLQPGDGIVVTRLDHDANVTPWVLVAQDRGCQVHYVDFHLDDGTLNMEQLQEAIDSKPRLVAVGYASNALGTINPVKKITELAHAVGALVYVDAVQYAPHGPLDVQDLGCDFLVISAYKFFGPHVGVLYGRYDLLDELTAYKVRPAPKDPPGKFETGTGNFEGYAGVLGAMEYFEWLGNQHSTPGNGELDAKYTGRRLIFRQAMAAIHEYEVGLSRALLEVLEETPGVKVYGLNDLNRLAGRVPTYAFTLEGMAPRQVAQALGKRNIQVWDGHYYAISVTESLGLEGQGGMVRVGPVHYNTLEEIERFGEALREIAI
jgi:cysteine desulfurase family protein (TIGR01976 family)